MKKISLDPELAAAIPMLPPLPFHDLASTRRVFDEFFESDSDPEFANIDFAIKSFTSSDGAEIGLRIFTPRSGRKVKAGVFDIHGGGFAIGTAKMDDELNAAIALGADVVVVSVEYRRSPEFPFPIPARDCFEGLLWMVQNSDELGIDKTRIAVHGDSAGGGLAATVCLWARDNDGPKIAMQSILEPELDDRCDTQSMLECEETPVWYRENAILSWKYYLGDSSATRYSSPARMEELSGLPPTYITVNQFDPLLDEGLDYARRLTSAGVFTELVMWPGAYHGFDLVETASITHRAGQYLHSAFRRGLYGIF